MTEQDSPKGNQFGTLGGVFTPSILTILGVVMFMQAGSVVGRAGIGHALLILLFAKAITFFTSLSIAAISTNTPVKGGGAYFLISRSLGPEPGGAIGLTLFLAQALSVPFYIIGFTQALVGSFPSLKAYFLLIAVLITTVLFIINLFGADWAIRVQYLILAVLVLSIFVFLGGAVMNFKVSTFKANWSSNYTSSIGFWFVFATYFPAVTGIMTGVNMSGDLKEPEVSIPKGTFYAIGVGFVVYFLEILICGGAQTGQQLVGNFYPTLLEQSLFGLKFLVVAGVFAASLSSAMGSMMGGPRILQALSRDDIFSMLKPFAKGSKKGDEPIRGLVLTFIMTIIVLVASQFLTNALDAIGAVLTMFFLYAYGITNVAAFFETVTQNPSFRPRFRYFHWSTALLGAFGCLFAAVLINWSAAFAATVIIIVLFFYVQRRVLSTTFGDVRRGFYYTRVRENLHKLASKEQHPKNWRPTTLVLSGNPLSRLTLTQYAVWLESGRGVATLVQVIVGKLEEHLVERNHALEGLEQFIQDNQLATFAEVLVAEDFDQGLAGLLQSHSLAPLKPNLVMLGWPKQEQRATQFVGHLRVSKMLDMSMVITVDKGLPQNLGRKRRVDIWWRGNKNGSLMMILAYLLSHNAEWKHAEIRVLRVIHHEEERKDAEKEVIDLLKASRIHGGFEIVLNQGSFVEVLQRFSCDATVVFLGFEVPAKGKEEFFHNYYSNLIEGLPTTLLISSSGKADLFA